MNKLANRKYIIIIVQIVTLSRAVACIAFISIALIPKHANLATVLLVYACLSDLLDGFLARKFSCVSKTGATLDLFSDKYLTIISLMYVVAKGIPIIPCAIAILREVFLLSVRGIQIKGMTIFPPQRILGTITIIPIWVGAIMVLQYPTPLISTWSTFTVYYWVVGIFALLNLVYKVTTNWKMLIESFKY